MMILKEFSRIVCVSLFSYQGSLLVCLSDSLFTLPHLIDCVKYFFEVFYFSKFKTSNGEGGIWTLAPLLTTYSLSRGAPSATWVLLQAVDSFKKKLFQIKIEVLHFYSGEGGIRTHGGLTLTGFQDRHHKPLGHLSKCVALHYNIICIWQCQHFFTTFFKVFYFIFIFRLFFLYL